MEKENINFVAIDFETMTPELTSACAVGMVQVVNGVIMQKFYSLIKPYPDERTELLPLHLETSLNELVNRC